MRIGFTTSYAFCALLAASTVSAQQLPPDPATILKSQGEQTAQLAATWLHGGDPRLQAWGAYLALRDHDKQLVPDLVGMVSSYEVTGWPVLNTRQDAHDAMLAALDAVIQMDGEVGASDAAKLYPEFPTQALILLSRAGENANNFLLNIFRTENSQLRWLAAGNMLANRRARGFAAAVLGGMTVHETITVRSSDLSGGGTGVGWACDSGPGEPKGKSDWPEIGTYFLVEHVPGATLIADGADPAYYIRTVTTLYDRGGHGFGGCSGLDPVSWDLFREHWLSRMLGEVAYTPPLRSAVQQSIIWKNGDSFVAYLREAALSQQKAFRDVAIRLKDACLMTEKETSSAEPHLELTIVDNREDKTTPLPRVENLGGNVIVKM